MDLETLEKNLEKNTYMFISVNFIDIFNYFFIICGHSFFSVVSIFFSYFFLFSF